MRISVGQVLISMQIPNHIIASWCIGAPLLHAPRDRFFCILAGTLADLDGAGIVAGVEYYQKYHHVLGHNFAAGILLSTVLAAFSFDTKRSFFLYLLSFHLHLILDLLGSGEGWGIYYLWPLSSRSFENPYVWDLQSWQNGVALAFFVVWMLMLIVRLGHTPVELLAPRLDALWAEKLRRLFYDQDVEIRDER